MWRGRLLGVRVRLAVRADTPGLGTHNLLVAGWAPPAPLQSLFFRFAAANSSIIHRLQEHCRGEDPWCARWVRVS